MRKFLRIYTPFTLNEIKAQLSYRGALLLFFFCGILSSFIAYYLWIAIYDSSTSGVIEGLTKNQMILYVFMSYITSNLALWGISEDISEDVVQGRIALNLIKPMDYRISMIFKAIGIFMYRFFIPCIFLWLGLELYQYFFLTHSFTPLPNILFYLVSVILSFFIHVLFDFCFSMISFFTTYIFGLKMIKDALLSFLSGALIPIRFFPPLLRKVFHFLPFSSMIYTPVMIYIGGYTQNEIVQYIGLQFVWIVVLYMTGSIIWKQVTKRLVVLGG